jgi:hypothetical protein
MSVCLSVHDPLGPAADNLITIRAASVAEIPLRFCSCHLRFLSCCETGAPLLGGLRRGALRALAHRGGAPARAGADALMMRRACRLLATAPQ